MAKEIRLRLRGRSQAPVPPKTTTPAKEVAIHKDIGPLAPTRIATKGELDDVDVSNNPATNPHDTVFRMTVEKENEERTAPLTRTPAPEIEQREDENDTSGDRTAQSPRTPPPAPSALEQDDERDPSEFGTVIEPKGTEDPDRICMEFRRVEPPGDETATVAHSRETYAIRKEIKRLTGSLAYYEGMVRDGTAVNLHSVFQEGAQVAFEVRLNKRSGEYIAHENLIGKELSKPKRKYREDGKDIDEAVRLYELYTDGGHISGGFVAIGIKEEQELKELKKKLEGVPKTEIVKRIFEIAVAKLKVAEEIGSSGKKPLLRAVAVAKKEPEKKGVDKPQPEVLPDLVSRTEVGRIVVKAIEERERKVGNDLIKHGILSRWRARVEAVAMGLIVAAVLGIPPLDMFYRHTGITSPFRIAASYVKNRRYNIYSKIYENAVYADNGNIEVGVKARAAAILNDSGRGNDAIHLSKIFDIYDWMAKKIQYLTVEQAAEPQKASTTLLIEKGDCKNVSTTFAALTIAIGSRTAFIFSPGHVYNGVLVAKRGENYETVKKTIRDMIQKRYGLTPAEVALVSFKEDDEGLWLKFDLAITKGVRFPGLHDGQEEQGIISFGATLHTMDLK